MLRPALPLPSPAATTDLAAGLGPRLKPGDVLLLDGPVGAGKSHFARSLIQALQDIPEDVPSPTFTLVQTYDTKRGPIWHCDLYRLSTPDELVELGLTDAFDTAICLIEWPDRLGAITPPGALTLHFSLDPVDPEMRHLSFETDSNDWTARLPESVA